MVKLSKKIISLITAASLVSGFTLTSLPAYEAGAATNVSINEFETYENGILNLLDDSVESYEATNYGLTSNVKDGTILHAWCWSFNTIKDNLKDIAASGFTTVQTSPANECLVGDNGGMAIWNESGGGKWEYHYQPTDWKIGNYQLGSRDDFKAMCDEADKYGVKIIVDVLPNHTTPQLGQVAKSLFDAAGGHEKLFHAEGFNSISQWENRFYCTNGAVLGLPDVNTENPGFQKYYLNYLNDLVDCGVDGFRYDTAKHIGLPDDPQDNKTKQYGWRNNFWPVALGHESVDGVTLHNKDNLFTYGEVLQSSGSRDSAYANYLSLTASNYGHTLRSAVQSKNFSTGRILDWNTSASPSKLVTWVESHDTYANAGESAGVTDWEIRMAWAIIAARKDGTPLFFSRPDGSSPGNRWGNNRMGVKGNDNFKHPEVQAVNKFRNAMVGEAEYLRNYDGGQVLSIERGKKGQAIINLGGEKQLNNQITNLADGTYTDLVSGRQFVVSGGRISGNLTGGSVTVLFNYKVGPKVSASRPSGNFDENEISVTLNSSSTSSAQYSINGGAKQSFTNGQVIKLGSGLANGEKVTLTLYGTGEGESVTETYNYTKKVVEYKQGYLYATKQSGWGTMKAYVYDESSGTAKQLAQWPGTNMTLVDDMYQFELPSEWRKATTQVIFTDGNNQYPASRMPGEFYNNDKAMYFNGAKIEQKSIRTVSELVAGNITTNKVSPQNVNTEIKISTEVATGGDGGYTYKFEVNGKELQGFSTSTSVNWTPSTAGAYTIKVTSKDSNADTVSKTIQYAIYQVNEDPIVITNIDTNRISPQKVNTTINLSTEVEDGKGTKYYKFVAKKDGTTTFDSGYITSDNIDWTPDVAGNYTLYFYAKDDTGSDYGEMTYVIEESASKLLRIDSLKANIASPQNVGTAIKLGASASNVTGTARYKYDITKNGVSTFTRAYSTTNNATWTPTEAGTYVINCTVKDDRGVEVSKTINYVINSVVTLKINSANTNLASPQKADTPIKLSASAVGQGTLNYRFVVLKDGVAKYVRGYKTSNNATWTPTEPGNYTIYFKVKDATGKEATVTKNYVVEQGKALTITSLKTNLASPQQMGTMIKIGALAKSATGKEIKYKINVFEGISGWRTLTAFSTTNNAVWKPQGTGLCYIQVEARDSEGNREIKMIPFQIESALTRVEQNNSKIKYEGKWTGATDANASAKGVRYTKEEGANLSFTFTGTGIRIIAPKSPTKGVAIVTVDGKEYEVDLYSKTNLNQQVVLEVKGLNQGTHTIKVESFDIKNINSSNSVISIDAFDIFDGNIN